MELREAILKTLECARPDARERIIKRVRDNVPMTAGNLVDVPYEQEWIDDCDCDDYCDCNENLGLDFGKASFCLIGLAVPDDEDNLRDLDGLDLLEARIPEFFDCPEFDETEIESTWDAAYRNIPGTAVAVLREVVLSYIPKEA